MLKNYDNNNMKVPTVRKKFRRIFSKWI